MTLGEIETFVREQTGHDDLAGHMSLQDDLHMYGDDVEEFMMAFGERFQVDLSGYLWYFHTGEEGGPNFGALFFPPPNARVEEIPITMDLLRESAEAGRWVVQYPDHVLPKRRYDVVVNQAIALLLGLIGIYVLVQWLLR